MNIRPSRQPIGRLLRFVGGVLPALVATLGGYLWLMQPPPVAPQRAALYLGSMALLSVTVAYMVIRTGFLDRLSRVQWAIIAIALVTAGLTFVSSWAPAAWIMAGQAELRLFTLLLLFAALIAISVMLYLAAPLIANLRALSHAAYEITRGRLATRVHLHSRDETALLARALNQLAAQLDQSSRRQQELDSLRRELIGWLGHDLRTPLASVRAIVEAVAEGAIDDPVTAQRYLHTVKRDLDTLSALTDTIFEMAQINAGALKLERRHDSLADLIHTTIEDFGEIATRKTIRIEVAILPGIDPVLMDSSRIGRVLAGLIENALRHTPNGGKITIRAYPVPDGVAVDVADNGEGIGEADLPHIFDQFYRAESLRRSGALSAGLGLAIARGIVEAHGGRISAQSTPGQGTTVSFRIPQTIQVEVRNPLRRWRGRSVDGEYTL